MVLQKLQQKERQKRAAGGEVERRCLGPIEGKVLVVDGSSKHQGDHGDEAKVASIDLDIVMQLGPATGCNFRCQAGAHSSQAMERKVSVPPQANEDVHS